MIRFQQSIDILPNISMVDEFHEETIEEEDDPRGKNTQLGST
jgi:hypothetical protein